MNGVVVFGDIAKEAQMYNVRENAAKAIKVAILVALMTLFGNAGSLFLFTIFALYIVPFVMS